MALLIDPTRLAPISALYHMVPHTSLSPARFIPQTVLIGHPRSDAVVVTLGSPAGDFAHLLSRAALVGPCVTDVPGVDWMIETLSGSGIRKLLLAGKDTAFHVKEAIACRLGPDYILLESEEALSRDAERIDLAVRFIREDRDDVYRKVEKGRDPFDDVAFAPFVDEKGVFVFVYNRDRRLVDRIRGKSDDVMDHILRTYDISPAHILWLIRSIYRTGPDERPGSS